MEAEELIKYLKKCCEVFGDEYEPIITPTKGDPRKKQNHGSIIMMEKVDSGRIPRFTINVNDNIRSIDEI